MEESKTERSSNLARNVRKLLLASIFGMVVLILSASLTGERSLNPFALKSANAELISAAPGFLALSANIAGINTSSNFYLIDSTKHVICVYQLKGEKIRLTAARQFEKDTDIVDSSLDVTGGDGRVVKSFEGGNGLDRAEAENYAEGLKKLVEAAEKSK